MEVKSGLNQSSGRELLSYSHYQNKIAWLLMQNSKPVLLTEDDCQADSIVHHGAKFYLTMAELLREPEQQSIFKELVHRRAKQERVFIGKAKFDD